MIATQMEFQSLLIGLIGWAATFLVVENASRLTRNDKRAMTVCSWVLWMAPAFGALVLQGNLTTDLAAFYVGISTIALSMIMLVGAFVGPRTHP